jgi:hypothetical protein
MQIGKDDDKVAKVARRRNRSPYPEKGLVANLRSTADKLSTVATRAMEEEELPEEAIEAVRALVEQASEALTQIERTHRGEPEPLRTGKRRGRLA